MGRVTGRRRITRIDGQARVARPDTLVREEPLEIRVGGRPVAVTMRTPGRTPDDDVDLVAGFCWTERLIRWPDHLAGVRHCAAPGTPNTFNVADVTLREDAPPVDPSVTRAFYTTSSCGVCGKSSIDAVRVATPFDVKDDAMTVDPAVLASLPNRLRERQQVFDRTGGLHAAGIFDADGTLLCLREDVGRHNAVDKVVGWALRSDRLPLTGTVLVVSGRASFELAQKAWVAGVPVLAAVSAPSTLAAELADEAGMTLAGFVRDGAMNVYAGAHRIREPGAGPTPAGQQLAALGA